MSFTDQGTLTHQRKSGCPNLTRYHLLNDLRDLLGTVNAGIIDHSACLKEAGSLVVLTELVPALGAVVKDSSAFIGGTELESVEVHLFVSTARTLLLDGGLFWLLIVSKRSSCVDKLSLLPQC